MTNPCGRQIPSNQTPFADMARQQTAKAGACSSHTLAVKANCLQHARRDGKLPSNVIPDRVKDNITVFESDVIKGRKSIMPLIRAAEKKYTERRGRNARSHLPLIGSRCCTSTPTSHPSSFWTSKSNARNSWAGRSWGFGCTRTKDMLARSTSRETLTSPSMSMHTSYGTALIQRQASPQTYPKAFFGYARPSCSLHRHGTWQQSCRHWHRLP